MACRAAVSSRYYPLPVIRAKQQRNCAFGRPLRAVQATAAGERRTMLPTLCETRHDVDASPHVRSLRRQDAQTLRLIDATRDLSLVRGQILSPTGYDRDGAEANDPLSRGR